ncbi:ZIP family metal transporter [Aureisphaera galaxeae]|uniref:ZIP family metal transporter n=1 Tax=Aureisphaera galaxeae TaxID=1538023 RepID=UPI00234FBFC1|nr:ZIP family metal transporter [Aureisphaera galaxeae]MDC8004413.1 ZIP family metal transporter [Aureisphaera galaxeae]
MSYLLLFLAVVLGYGIAVFFQKKGIKQMPQILAFSGAFLLSITLFELLPEVFESENEHIGLYIMLGILLQIVLDFFSKGAEHGHVHISTTQTSFPWLLFFSLAIHALLEGFPVTHNESMLVGVIVHKIPIVIILTLFFQRANFGRATTLVFLFLFACMTPLGTWFSTEIDLLKEYAVPINSIAIGIFLHVSTTILFESSKDHKFNLVKLLSIILGIVLAYFV